jgi:hypothetical protein
MTIQKKEKKKKKKRRRAAQTPPNVDYTGREGVEWGGASQVN